jgi:hypothetical protein
MRLRGRIVAVVVAVAPVVAQAVDDAGRGDRDPQHLHGPDRDAGHAEQRDVQRQQRRHAQPAVLRVQVVLDPVVRAAVAVLVQGFLVLGFGAIQLRAFAAALS